MINKRIGVNDNKGIQHMDHVYMSSRQTKMLFWKLEEYFLEMTN